MMTARTTIALLAAAVTLTSAVIAFTPVSVPGDQPLKTWGDDTERALADLTDRQAFNTSRVERLVHERINHVRSQRGLPPLESDPELRRLASNYSEWMATAGFYSHTSPTGGTFEDRYRRAGYDCHVEVDDGTDMAGAENILLTYALTEIDTSDGSVVYGSDRELAHGIVQSWMTSESHRQIILKDYWTVEGIGVHIVENPKGEGVKVYVTQYFC